VADIAALKLKVGEPITQAQIDAVAAVADKLEKKTSDLKAGE